MNEDSTAVAGDPRTRVMVDLDEEIIEPVGALEPVAWFIGRPPERPVVAPVFGIFTPGIVRRDRPNRQLRARARQTVSAPPQPHRTELPCRRRAIAFAFRRLDAGPAQGGANSALPRHEPGLPAQLRPGVNM